MPAKYDFIIYHKSCIDGFTSFIILNKKMKYIDDDAIIHPDMPSAKLPPNNIDGKHIIIMDVAYKYDVLKEIVERAKSVLFIDHHKTIHDDVMRIKSNNLEIVYNEEECGASLVWNYFFPKKKVPLFIRYVKDNDIGAWKLYGTRHFIAGLEVNYDLSISHKNIKKWFELFDKDIVKQLRIKGKTYYEYIGYLLDHNSKKYSMEAFPSQKIYEEFTSFFDKPAQYKVAVVCGSGCPNTSLLGNKMMEIIDCDFVLFWTLNMDTKEYVVAFRSNGVDVGNIAHMFGGGGHKFASACSFPITRYNITDLFMPQSLPRQLK